MDALDQYVTDLRASKGDGVPAFSEHDGRTNAKILFLHRDPGRSGASRTRVVDRGNPYSTAKNFREANERVGLDRKLTIVWNAVPWPVGESTFALELEKVRSERWLDRLLALLPHLRVVVLLSADTHKLTRTWTRRARTFTSSTDLTRVGEGSAPRDVECGWRI
jgi:uracil-DNA glycosylase